MSLVLQFFVCRCCDVDSVTSRRVPFVACCRHRPLGFGCRGRRAACFVGVGDHRVGELLDHTLIWNERQHRGILDEYVEYHQAA